MRTTRWLLRAPAAGVLVVLQTGGFLAHAGADDSATVALTARADIATVEYYDTGVPLVPPHTAVTQLSPTTAQAAVDSLGSSTALASAPDPGEFIRSVPGTVAGGTGLPVPPYPLVVQSNYPTQKKSEVAPGPYRITATSGVDTSTGETRTGLSEGGAELASSHGCARVSHATGTPLVAEATADLGALSVGQTLRIADISSVARLTLVPGGEPTITTTTSIGAVTVNGVPVTVTAHGIEAAGTVVPVDASPAQQLKAAGIDLRYFPAQRTKTSVLSAALVVTTTQTDPAGSTRTTSLTLGQVTAAVSYIAGPSDAPAQRDNPAPGGDLPAGPAATAPGVSPATVDLPGPARLATGPTLASGPAPASTTAVGTRSAVPAPSFLGLYLFCIAGGSAALVASRVLGLAAVRLHLRSTPG